MALHLFVHLIAQTQTVVVHREQEAFDLQGRIQLRLDDLDRIQQFSDALQRKELALYRDDDAVAGRQGIDRDQAQRRTAVDQDIVIFVAHLIQDILQ